MSALALRHPELHHARALDDGRAVAEPRDRRLDARDELIELPGLQLERAHAARDAGPHERTAALVDRGVEDQADGDRVAAVEQRDWLVVGHGRIVACIDAARALAWWTHVNLIGESYRARKAAFARLRAALCPIPRRGTFELRAVVKSAWLLAGCSDSNRYGVTYYERKAAFAQLRGALFAYDERAAGR